MRKLIAAIALILSAPAWAAAADLGSPDSLQAPIREGAGASWGAGFYTDFGVGASMNSARRDHVERSSVYTPETDGTPSVYTPESLRPKKKSSYTSETPGTPSTNVVTEKRGKLNRGYSGALAETRIGYDWKFGQSGWFAGPAAGVAFDWANGADLHNGFGYRLGGRLGYGTPMGRVFAESGFTGQRFETGDATGWYAGAGAELQVTQRTYLFVRGDVDQYHDNQRLVAMAGMGFRW